MSIEDKISQFETCQVVDLPHHILWGVSSAAYQVEGNLMNSNFYQWEQLVIPGIDFLIVI